MYLAHGEMLEEVQLTVMASSNPPLGLDDESASPHSGNRSASPHSDDHSIPFPLATTSLMCVATGQGPQHPKLEMVACMVQGLVVANRSLTTGMAGATRGHTHSSWYTERTAAGISPGVCRARAAKRCAVLYGKRFNRLELAALPIRAVSHASTESLAHDTDHLIAVLGLGQVPQPGLSPSAMRCHDHW